MGYDATAVYLSKDQFQKLQSCEIGRGTDGAVYKYSNSELIKIYHANFIKILTCIKELSDEDIKIYKKGSIIKKTALPITAYFYNEEENEHLRLPIKEASRYAISRQKDVTMTRLPKNMVYIENIFAGYLLDKAPGIQIHKLIGLPLLTKKKIILQLIKKIKELLDNNIYHIDLNNSPFSGKSVFINPSGNLETVGHSHVLVDHKLEPHIIDLDGKSTVYTEKYNEKYERYCLKGLCELLIELFFDFDIDDLENCEFELDALCEVFERYQVKHEYIEKIFEYKINIDEIEELVKGLNKVPKL